MKQEQYGLINIHMKLVIPTEIMSDKEAIADYLNKMLYEDPEFFGDFGEENIEIVKMVDDD